MSRPLCAALLMAGAALSMSLAPGAVAAQGALTESLRPVLRDAAPTETAPAAAAPADAGPVRGSAFAADGAGPELRDTSALRPLALAMDAVRAEAWDAALDRASGDGPVAQDIVRWHALRDRRGDARAALDFLARRPDWPGLPYLRAQMEPTLSGATPTEILAFFAGHVPETGTGALALARAQRASGSEDAARAAVEYAWRSLRLSEEEHVAFLDRHADEIAPHHAARLDNALWQGWTVDALRMEGLVAADRWALARARLSLQRGGSAGALPDTVADDPGLAFDRYARLGGAEARQVLLARSTGAAALGRPEIWAPSRRPMARQLMRAGDLETAYRVASTHFTTAGTDFADLEWLSGYLALRLGRPEQALAHFERFRADVLTPISVARAGYWLGRAHRALGDEAAAVAAFVLGARHQTAFYGLLAAEAGGIAFPADLRGVEPEGDWRDAAFTRSSVHQAAVLLLAAGEARLAERFWTHLAESLDAGEIALMGKMLRDLGQPHIQVMLGKRAAQAGLEIAAPYYALHPMAARSWPVPTELMLAIARRESEFDHAVVSPAGARGLMQVMPATAREVARDLGLPFAEGRLTRDEGYNAALGAEYLRQMALRYDGNPVLISIAYNAGPSRADRWQELYGPPTAPGVDIVDWIEGIPFRETRNYVMRVTESLPVYRARLGLDPLPQPFSELLAGSSLRPGAVEGE